MSTATPTIIDVRTIEPRFRHSLIFQTFGALAPGDHFVLVNDHDPKPLQYQFQAEMPDTYTWTYEKQGPEVWQVRIGKSA